MKSTWRIAVAFAVVAAAACGGDDQESADTSTTSTASAVEEPTQQGPVRIGFVNFEAGAISLPEVRLGAEVGAAYVLEEFGGVSGRPIEYVGCNVDGSPEAAVDCANQFVEAGVVAVQLGVAPAADSMLPILATADIPIIGHLPLSKAEQTDPLAFYFGSPVAADGAGSLSYLAEQGAGAVTFFLPEDPSVRAAESEVLQPVAQDLGVTYRTVWYDPGSPDWSVLATTAMVDRPDAIGSPFAAEQDCMGFVGALRAAAFEGSILAGTCSLFIDVLGPQAEGVLTTSSVWRPTDLDAVPAAKRAELEAYLAAMTASGNESEAGSFAYVFFSDTVNLALILSEVEGDIDGTAVQEAMAEVSGFDSFMGPVLDCASAKSAGVTSCGSGQLVYEVDAEGSQRALTEDFIDLSPFMQR